MKKFLTVCLAVTFLALVVMGVVRIVTNPRHWIRGLQSEDAEQRREAVEVLARRGAGAREAVPALLKVMRTDPVDDLRGEAAAALGDILAKLGPEGREAVPALTEALADKDPRTRERAAAVLGRMGGNARDAVPALVKALRDEYGTVRKEAAAALRAIDPEAAAEALRRVDADKEAGAGP
jgi:hypothetical protein